MTIDKKVAVDKFNEEVKKQIDQAIPLIDRKLENVIDGSSVTILYEDLKLPEINHAVFKAVGIGIVMEYEENGWKVKMFEEEDVHRMYFSFS